MRKTRLKRIQRPNCARRAVLALAALWLGAPRLVFADSRPVRIGFLSPRRRSESFYSGLVLKRLAELGYLEGRNLILEFRSADGVASRFSPLARELVEAHCDLIFALGPLACVRALLATGTATPIVFIAITYDPVTAGVVSNLRRPGQNVTGIYFGNPGLAAKRLELLQEILPDTRRVLVLADGLSRQQVAPVRDAAKLLHIDLVTETFTQPPYDFSEAFAKGRKAGVTAVDLLSSPAFANQRARIAALAVQYRWPIIASPVFLRDPGFLAGYGESGTNRLLARASEMAAEILQGRKPGDIPVEAPTQFDLVINLKTAKQLGIDIPSSVLLRANRSIE